MNWNFFLKPPASDSVQFREDVLERFIPISLSELADDLSAAAPVQREAFRAMSRIFVACTYLRFHERLRGLKRAYLPFSPDPDTVTRRVSDPAQRLQQSARFLDDMRELLDDANFEELSRADLQKALEKISPHGIQVSVDYDDFDQAAVFYRGSARKVEYLRDWHKLYLAWQRWESPVYRRLFVLIKLKDPERRVQELTAQGMSARRARRRVAATWSKLPEEARHEGIYLKLFKDIPATDLEMLFPTVRVRMRLFDKIKLGITGGGGTIGGLVATVSKITASLNPYTVATALAGFIGIVARQVGNVFHQRTKYMMALAQHLYFHNLSNNLGVISYLLDMARDEENKEALLAYYFLYYGEDKPYTAERLDQTVESYIREEYGIAVDFEVNDGLEKLRKIGVLMENPDGTLQVEAPQAVCKRLQVLGKVLFEGDGCGNDVAL